MNIIVQILQYVLPLLIIMGMVYFLLSKFFANEREKREHALQMAKNNIVLPVRLQAYERIVLLLERISFNNLILRINRPALNCGELQTELINSIREEYNHNLSQQVYISASSWEFVRVAVEETIRVINTAGASVERDAQSFELVTQLLEAASAQETNPATRALGLVKKEAGSLL